MLAKCWISRSHGNTLTFETDNSLQIWLYRCSFCLTTERGRCRRRWFPSSPARVTWTRPSGYWSRRDARGGSTQGELSGRWSTSSAGSWYHQDPPETKQDEYEYLGVIIFSLLSKQISHVFKAHQGIYSFGASRQNLCDDFCNSECPVLYCNTVCVYPPFKSLKMKTCSRTVGQPLQVLMNHPSEKKKHIKVG